MPDRGDPVFEFDRTSTVDQVADRLRRMIWRGELAPGYRLKEVPLSESFGVSRNTIRDALRNLALDGLLTHELHRGAIVRELGADDVADLYLVRRLVEGSALGAGKIKERHLEAIRAAVVGIERAVEDDDWEGAVAADREFHAAVVAMLESPRIDQFYDQISAESRFALGILWLHDATKENVAEVLAAVAAEHRSIFKAIEQKKGREARRLLEEHLSQNEERLLEILAARVPTPT